MSTQIRKGVEIFSTGTWNKGTFTIADLDAMVESFEALELSGKIPLKLGHEGPDGRLVVGARNKDGTLKDPMSQFAMGWVNKVYRKGSKLYADIEVSDKVAKLIDDKFVKFVSVELFNEVRASRKVFPWVLDAVALLGTDNPAVGILSDIQTLAMSARTPLEHKACLMFAREGVDAQLINIGVKPKMADKDDNQTLADQILALTQRMAALESENSNLKIKVVEGTQAQTRFTELQKKVEADNLKAHRALIYRILDDAVRTEDMLPAAALRFKKTYRTEDDAVVMEISEEDVREFVTENPNPKKTGKAKKAFSVKSSQDDVPDGVSADVAVVALTFAQLRESGINKPTDEDIERAAIEVLSKNRNANDAYKKFTADAHSSK